MTGGQRLDALQPGQLIPFGGDRAIAVPQELADSFVAGDRLVVLQDSGVLLHIPAREHAVVDTAVERAHHAFIELAAVTDEQISTFYASFADLLADDGVFGAIAAANEADVVSARSRGRTTTRLELSPAMRLGMIEGLRMWRDSPSRRDAIIESIEHSGWSVTARRAPLGVVGFVFEGRPNVFADATGVLRTGNTAVMRIGSDALGTAVAIMHHALEPAARAVGLPHGVVSLVESSSRATGWALFADPRLALAVARGSGVAVGQLGAVARQSGVPVSLHGAGGAWLIASAHADPHHFSRSVVHSLDRKVCNTLNVCCIVADRARDLVPIFVDAIIEASTARDAAPCLHVESSSTEHVPAELFARRIAVDRAEGAHDEPLACVIPVEDIGTEWEWEEKPEVTLMIVADIDHAVTLFNQYSPRLAASLISTDPGEHASFYDRCAAPFIGNGFTRWVDGQFALDRPELGLSNWENGRLFARSAVLSGDSVFTTRLVASVTDSELQR